MQVCEFCLIAKKEKSSLILYEDENALSFIGEKDPFGMGHCIVISKRHTQSITDLNSTEIVSTSKIALAVSKALKKKLNAENVYLISIGDRVQHTHFHLIPRLSGQVSMGKYCFGELRKAEPPISITPQELKKMAKDLRELLKENIK